MQKLRSGLPDLERDGAALRREVIPPDQLSALRREAERLAADAGTACVRDIDHSSGMIRQLAQQDELRDLLPAGLEPVRFILFDKTSRENWPVGWHQDLTIAVRRRVEVAGYRTWSVKNGVVHTQPPIAVMEAMVTLRIHLDDTPATNGALRVVPGSHRLGRIPTESIGDHVRSGQLTCACEGGDVLMMKPLVLHASSRSSRQSHRRVLHIEFARRDLLDRRLAWHLAA